MKIKFSYIMLILAIGIAGCAGYFSIWGLSQLFAGAGAAVIVMASFLEVGKIITTTALHRYWNEIPKTLKFYLVISVGVLMIITSAGIYGFLSNAYQKTANKLEIHEGEVGVLTNKKAFFQKNIDANQKIIDNKNKRIDQLTNLRTTQESRMDEAKNSWTKESVRKDIKAATEEIQKLTGDIDGLNVKNATLTDSIGKYDGLVLGLESTNDVAGEVGPLKYISNLTGQPMDKVVNILILLLIFVFDPLAVAMVLMTNRIFELQGEIDPLEKKKPVEPIKEPIIEKPIVVETPVEVPVKEEPIIDNIVSGNTTINEAVIADVIEEPLEEPMMEEEEEEEEIVEEHITKEEREPVIPTGKVNLEDIKEIKDRTQPQQRGRNTIERIGSNKVVKNGDNNRVFFRRDQ